MESAIARGAGKSLSGVSLENLTIEAMLPSSVATVIECQTDNRLRTMADVRHIIKELGGTVSPTTHMFERRGRITLEKAEHLKEEDVLDQAIEAGASDLETEGNDHLIIYTEPQQTSSAAEALAKVAGLRLESLDIIWYPKADSLVQGVSDEVLEDFVGKHSLSTPDGEAYMIADKLEEDPSVQNVFLNAA